MIGFHSVPEQTIFNGNSILFRAILEQLLLWFRMERYILISFGIKKKLWNEKSYRIIYLWNETEREVSLLEAQRYNFYSIKQSCWLMKNV